MKETKCGDSGVRHIYSTEQNYCQCRGEKLTSERMTLLSIETGGKVSKCLKGSRAKRQCVGLCFLTSLAFQIKVLLFFKL